MKAACFTGHRPNKLNGYEPSQNKELLWTIHECVINLIEKENIDTFINGVALGVDQWSAKIVLKLKEKYPHIKLISAVPCKNQHKKWKAASRKEWQYIIDNSDQVIYVTEEEYNSKCMQERNEWMVLNSEIVIAVWNGTSGGTGNCVKFAQQKNKRIINLWKQ